MADRIHSRGALSGVETAALATALQGEEVIAPRGAPRLRGDAVRFIVETVNRAAGPTGCMVVFKGWTIEGRIDLKGQSGLGHLGLVRCDLIDLYRDGGDAGQIVDPGELDVEFADLRGLDLAGSDLAVLSGMRARVRGSVYLKRYPQSKRASDAHVAGRRFRCRRGVDLSGAWIEGSLSCRGADFGFDPTPMKEDDWIKDPDWRKHFPSEPHPGAPEADRPVEHPFCMNLRHTTVGGTLYIGPKHAQEFGEKGDCLLLGSADFSGLRVREFVDHGTTYAPLENTRHRLVLDGFEYERFGSCSPQDHQFRVGKWLAMQPNAFAPRPDWRDWLLGRRTVGREFQPQPYEQLAKVLKVMGHDADAKEVLFSRRRNQAFHALTVSGRVARLSLWPFVWLYAFVTGLGYKSTSLVGAITLLVSAHAVVLSEAANRALIAPADATLHASSWWSGCRTSNVPESSWLGRARVGADGLNECLKRETGAGTRYVEHPRFNALFYAIESFFPVLNLEQRSKWTISDREPEGAALRWWMGFYTMLGWVGTSLLVAGLFARFNQRGGD